jgi:predicted AlkP superfamily phosphohydrolase/phosphomutase
MKLIAALLLLTSCAKVLDTKDYVILSEGYKVQCKYHEENNEYSECVMEYPYLVDLDNVKVISGIVLTIQNQE